MEYSARRRDSNTADELVEQRLNQRQLLHPHNPDKHKTNGHVYVPVTDGVYSKRFDYEVLDAEPLRLGFKKAYRVVCIPFVTYGINRGDIVYVDQNMHFLEKVRDGGEYGYRILYPRFNSDEAAHPFINETLAEIRRHGFAVEEFNHLMGAVSAQNREKAVKAEELFRQLTDLGRMTAFDTIRQ